jgi:hypothetical protein
MLASWLRAFIFTQLIEVPIYVRGAGCAPIAAFGASALTHPIIWFGLFSPRWRAPYSTRLIAAELFAWLVEAAYLRFALGRRRALLWSLVANAASLGLGMLSRRLFGGP